MLLNILKFIAYHPLTKRGYISAIWKFTSWQFLIRLNILKTVSINNLVKFKAVKGVVNSSGIYYVTLMEYNEMRALFQYCRKDDVLMDVGANIGTYSIFLSYLTGCKSFGFEPDISNYSLLKANIELNDVSKLVKIHNLALADKPGEIGFESGKDAISHINVASNNIVKCTSLDFFCHNNNVFPSIVKVDVEGFESLVFEGFLETLNSFSKPEVMLIELRGHGNKYGYDEKQLFNNLLHLGYTALTINFNPDTSSKIVTTYSKGDFFFVRNVTNFMSRLKSRDEDFKDLFES